jgi:hypothetical protein
VRARVAALGVVAVLLAACGSSSSSSTQPTGATDASFRCPDPAARARTGSGDTLPGGATAALICATDGDAAWAAPREALTHHVGRLVSLVNRLHHEGSKGMCNTAGGPAWRLLLRYPDGVRTVAGDNGGCDSLSVGATKRHGADRVYSAFARALLRQRAHQHPPGAVTSDLPSCPMHGFVFVPTAQARLLSRGSWCLRSGRHWHSDGPLTRAQLRVLQHDLATSAARSSYRTPDVSACRDSPGASGQIAGRDAWDDPLRIGFQCGFYVFDSATSRHAVYVRMLPATKAMVSSLR